MSPAKKFPQALQVLKEDHDRVRSLAEHFTVSGASLERRAIAQQIFLELEVHAVLEERHLYPALAGSDDEKAGQLVEEARQEHRQVKVKIATLKTLALGDHAFAAGVQEVIEAVEHHATEEESELFPRATEALSEQLEDLALQIEASNHELRAHKSPALAA